MPKITFKVVGAELVRNGLANLHRDIPKISRLRIKETMDKIAERLKKYPKPRAGQKYVRTYRLRDSVTVIKAGDMAYAIQVDPVRKGKHYGKYVLGDAKGNGQAWMHKGRWKLFVDVAEHELLKLPKSMEEHIKRASKGYGF